MRAKETERQFREYLKSSMNNCYLLFLNASTDIDIPSPRFSSQSDLLGNSISRRFDFSNDHASKTESTNKIESHTSNTSSDKRRQTGAAHTALTLRPTQDVGLHVMHIFTDPAQIQLIYLNVNSPIEQTFTVDSNLLVCTLKHILCLYITCLTTCLVTLLQIIPALDPLYGLCLTLLMSILAQKSGSTSFIDLI